MPVSRKHFHDMPFIVMEVDTSVMVILVLSWNTSTTTQVWLSWFCHKILMDVHAWKKVWPIVTNTYHHGSGFFVLHGYGLLSITYSMPIFHVHLTWYAHFHLDDMLWWPMLLHFTWSMILVLVCIFGRPFLNTVNATIDCKRDVVTIGFRWYDSWI